MKRLSALTLLLLLLLQLHAGAKNIPSGTLFVIQPQKLIDADDVKIGDQVNFHISQPVKAKGENVIPVGTEVIARVVKKKNNGILGIPGQIEIGEFQIKNTNNTIRLSGNISDSGENRYWANVGWIFVFPLLFIKGNDGKIQPYSTYMLYTAEEVDL